MSGRPREQNSRSPAQAIKTTFSKADYKSYKILIKSRILYSKSRDLENFNYIPFQFKLD